VAAFKGYCRDAVLDALLANGGLTGHAEAASMLSAEVTVTASCNLIEALLTKICEMVVGFHPITFVAQLLERFHFVLWERSTMN
jgi:hypothetical protein